MTLAAPSKRSFSRLPISRNGAIFIQHVFIVHDPDSPWHLQETRIKLFTAFSIESENGHENEIEIENMNKKVIRFHTLTNAVFELSIKILV